MAARKQRELITGAHSQGDRRIILPREIARCWSVMNNSNYRSDNNSGVETHHANQSAQPVLYPPHLLTPYFHCNNTMIKRFWCLLNQFLSRVLSISVSLWWLEVLTSATPDQTRPGWLSIGAIFWYCTHHHQASPGSMRANIWKSFGAFVQKIGQFYRHNNGIMLIVNSSFGPQYCQLDPTLSQSEISVELEVVAVAVWLAGQ